MRRHPKFAAGIAIVTACSLGGVFDAATVAAAGPPAVGAEHPVAGVRMGPAEALQAGTSVATDGTNFFVVWQDERDEQQLDGDDIFGARVRADGTLLDPTGIPIAVAPRRQAAPAVAFDGTNYLVVWQDGSVEGDVADVIRGARVAPDGTVLDPGGFLIASSAGEDLSNPSVAWNGSRYLVAYEQFDSAAFSTDIRGTRVTPTGAVLDANGFDITTAAENQVAPDVVAGGSKFYVVWTDYRRDPTESDIFGARVSNAGAVTPTTGAITARVGDQTDPSVGWNGSVFFVVWSETLGGSNFGDLYGARIGSGGGVQQRNIPIHVTPEGESFPDVVGLGSVFFVGWQVLTSMASNRPVRGARYDATGTALDGNDMTFATQGGTPSAAVSGPNSWYVAWSSGLDATSGGGEVRGAPASASGPTPAGGTLLSTSAASQGSPDVASDGHNSFVVWSETRDDRYRVVGSRVAPDGTRLDGAGIVLGGGSGNQMTPAVAWNGTNYFAVWYDGGAIVGTRVTPGGVVLDPAGIVVEAAPDNAGPDVAWNGSNFVVVWEHFSTTPPNFPTDAFAKRVSPSGVVLDANRIDLATGPGSEVAPTVATAGSTALVVWESNANIVGTRLANNGTVLDPSGIVVSSAPNVQTAPAVASNGSAFFAVWSDTRNGAAADVYGARVTTGGTVTDGNGIAVSTAPGPQQVPAIGFDGDYLVAWHDERNNPFGDLYGTRVDGATVVDTAGVPISTSPTRETSPAVTGGGDGSFAVAYQRFASTSPYGAHRVFLRTVAPK